MRRPWVTGVLMAVLATTAGMGIAAASGGGGEERGQRSGGRGSGEPEAALSGFPARDPVAAGQLATYRQECGDCHIAYPPALLDPAQWQRLLTRLEDHFGESATLSEPSLRAITAYLTVNAAPPGSVVVDAGGDLPRISASRWFREQHAEVAADVWQRAAVGSASNCAACHRQAVDGRYDEGGVKIPR